MRTIKIIFVVANVLVYSLLLLLILVFIALEETSSVAEVLHDIPPPRAKAENTTEFLCGKRFPGPPRVGQPASQIRHIAYLPEHCRSGSFRHRFRCQRLWYQGMGLAPPTMCFANSILQVMLVLARAEGMSKEFTKLKRKQTIKARASPPSRSPSIVCN